MALGTHHVFLPRLLGARRLQLFQVAQLAVQLVHPVRLSLRSTRVQGETRDEDGTEDKG